MEESKYSNFDTEFIINSIENNLKIPQSALMQLCKHSQEYISSKEKVIFIQSPVTVVGDIKGNIHNLKQIFKFGGEKSEVNYLFLGNYVDWGTNSIECISYLLALQLKYQTKITLLRGNHETEGFSKTYGFYEECKKKYDSVQLWKAFNSLFEYLPISAIIENEIFCVHSGLSIEIQNVEDINTLINHSSSSDNGPLYDLLQSDPNDDIDEWDLRHCGPYSSFGKLVTKQFLFNNGLKQIIRGHQVQLNGYRFFHDQKLCSIYSVPNFQDFMNMASIVKFDDAMNPQIITFQ